MTKEEIIAQLIILKGSRQAFIDIGFKNTTILDTTIITLEQQLQSAKSIEDIEREAYSSGWHDAEVYSDIKIGEDLFERDWEYYLKSKENGTTE